VPPPQDGDINWKDPATIARLAIGGVAVAAHIAGGIVAFVTTKSPTVVVTVPEVGSV